MDIISLLNTDADNVRTTAQPYSLEDEDYNYTTNANAIIQYLTCPKCQTILNEPITFQCGNSLCRGCIPINQVNNRKCRCPIYGCGKSHSLDCKTDVILQKLTEICRRELVNFLPLKSRQFRYNNSYNYNYNTNLLDEEDRNTFRYLDAYDQVMSDSEDDYNIQSSSRISSISSILNSSGYHDDSGSRLLRQNNSNNSHFDLRQIKDLLLAELDCQICCCLFVDPITTPCGHSFCKHCLTRSLDHNSACPICRQPLYNYNAYLHHSINKTIYSFIRALYPSSYYERKTMLESELFDTTQDTPMYVSNALVFPKMPCFLHIFEPRYKLMIRRCMQSRQRQFGMVLSRSTSYHNYGTMLEVRSAEPLADGRSHVETIGTYRFRVIERSTQDGYDVGRIERIYDISPEEEERIEREEIRRAEIYNSRNPLNPPIREYTTSELIGISRDFIDTLRNGNSPWLLQRLNSVYGDMPDDPSDFSFWVASVIPIAEAEKYKLLELRSVRDRLKLIVEWITSLRDQWWFSRGCSIS